MSTPRRRPSMSWWQVLVLLLAIGVAWPAVAAAQTGREWMQTLGTELAAAQGSTVVLAGRQVPADAARDGVQQLAQHWLATDSAWLEHEMSRAYAETAVRRAAQRMLARRAREVHGDVAERGPTGSPGYDQALDAKAVMRGLERTMPPHQLHAVQLWLGGSNSTEIARELTELGHPTQPATVRKWIERMPERVQMARGSIEPPSPLPGHPADAVEVEPLPVHDQVDPTDPLPPSQPTTVDPTLPPSEPIAVPPPLPPLLPLDADELRFVSSPFQLRAALSGVPEIALAILDANEGSANPTTAFEPVTPPEAIPVPAPVAVSVPVPVVPVGPVIPRWVYGVGIGGLGLGGLALARGRRS